MRVADVDAAIEAFGKNEQVKKVFWALFVAMAGLVLARCWTGDSSADCWDHHVGGAVIFRNYRQKSFQSFNV